MTAKPRILVAPLDWGIGHSTRCVPVIRELLRQGAEVIIASNGRPLKVLEREFPELMALKLPAYDVRYPFKNILLNVLVQYPRLVTTVIAEHLIVRHWIRKYSLDGVISDNRLGCFTGLVPTVVMTHQINLQAPGSWLSRVANRVNHFFLNRYDRCWVPDWQGKDNLSGVLSHPSPLAHTTFVGPLTRLKPLRHAKHTYDVLALLSGPEPQRTYLEKAILRQAASLSWKIVLVQGKPEVESAPEIPSHIRVIPFLDSEALSKAIAEASMVICRSGYSTLMDLAVLGKRALLVPTPGQTEQEYLADFLANSGSFITQTQEALNLEKGIPAVLALPEPDLSMQNTRLLEMAVREFLDAVSSAQHRGSTSKGLPELTG